MPSAHGRRAAGKPWSSTGDAGPEHWGRLDPAYALCANGKAQSPIDLTNATHGAVPALTLQWRPLSPLRLLNTGHHGQVIVPAGSHLTLGGVAYGLTQYHFHTPSEHRLDGVVAPMELHLAHVAESGPLAVLRLLLREGNAHPGLEPLFTHVPSTADDMPALVEVDAALDLTTLLPTERTTVRYAGSLTPPPCTEGVAWVVFAHPIALSPDQLAAYRAVFAPDARPIPPRHGRKLVIGD